MQGHPGRLTALGAMDRRQLLSLGERLIEPTEDRVDGHHTTDAAQLPDPELHLGGPERKSPPRSQLPGLGDQREEPCHHLTPRSEIADLAQREVLRGQALDQIDPLHDAGLGRFQQAMEQGLCPQPFSELQSPFARRDD
jgi:hypothetical protein